MERRIVYVGSIPQDLDSLKAQRNTMIALGWLAQGILGTDTLVDGLACTPTSPTSLSVNIGKGQVYQLANVDSQSFGSLAPDTQHNIVKQGIAPDDTILTLTPPATAGQAVNYLVQTQIIEQDVDVAVLPYFNPASLINPNAAPWSGPNNSGTAQPQTRRLGVVVSLKVGVAAAAGSQTTPGPDAGYVGLYAITVTQGQTQITAPNIVTLDTAPFINPKLPAVPGWTQAQGWCYGVDTGTLNNIVVNIQPAPNTYGPGGFALRVKAKYTNNGPLTVNVNGLGTKTILKPAGTACTGGEITANSVIEIIYDGTQFYLQTAQATNTNNSTGGLTTVAVSDPVIGDGTVGNPLDVKDATAAQIGVVTLATGAQYVGNSTGKALTPDAVWNAAGFQTVAYASGWTPDFSAGFNFQMNLTGPMQLNNPTFAKSGETGAILLTQGSTGGWPMNFPVGKVFYFPAGFPGLSTAPGAVDLLVYKVITPTFIVATVLKGLS